MPNNFEITYNPIEDDSRQPSEVECVAILSLEVHTPKEARDFIRTDTSPRNSRTNLDDKLFLEIKNGAIKRIRKL